MEFKFALVSIHATTHPLNKRKSMYLQFKTSLYTKVIGLDFDFETWIRNSILIVVVVVF